MTAYMVVHMTIHDPSWFEAYSKTVPALLTKHGGRSIAGARDIRRIAGSMPVPDRIAIFSFPSRDHIDAFMADPAYQPHRQAREAGSLADILVFDNAAQAGELI